MGKQILFGHEDSLSLDYESFDAFREDSPASWDFSRITIVASPTKAIVVPCIPNRTGTRTDSDTKRAAILITSSTTFKL